MKHSVKITFRNGNSLVSTINGTEAEVREYYSVGRQFNIGSGENDDIQRVSAIEFLKGGNE